jgi:hypothetical protein
MVLEEPELNIHVVAQTREALREELQNHISMLWENTPGMLKAASVPWRRLCWRDYKQR